MRQELVTKKNAKLRRLVELYPDLNIRMLYRRDCAAASSSRRCWRPVVAPGTSATHPSTMAG